MLKYGALILFAVLALAALRELPRIWTRNVTKGDAMPAAWLWGEALWRGWLRAMPLLVVAAAMLAFVALFGSIAMNVVGDRLSIAEIVFFVVPVGLVLTLFCATFALVVSVVLFSWPKVVVPPRLRDQSGAVWEWVGRPRK